MIMKVFKLTTGEEILATILEDNEANYVLENPVRLVFVPNEQRQQPQLAIVPFAMYSKDSRITVFKNQVVFDCDVDNQIESEYRRQFGSGIITNPTLEDIAAINRAKKNSANIIEI